MQGEGEYCPAATQRSNVEEEKTTSQSSLHDIPFQFHGPDADKNLLPSLDWIDSDGHYEAGNLQVVCQFINFWKGDSDNADFQRLLLLVRGIGQ